MMDNLFGGGFTGNGGVNAEWIWGDSPNEKRDESDTPTQTLAGLNSPTTTEAPTDSALALRQSVAKRSLWVQTIRLCLSTLWYTDNGNSGGYDYDCGYQFSTVEPPPTPEYAAIWFGDFFIPGGQGIASGGQVWGTQRPGTLTTVTQKPDITAPHARNPQPRTCDFLENPQACAHYLSVGNNNINLMAPVCDTTRAKGDKRRAPGKWSREHHTSWYRRWLPKSYSDPKWASTTLGCQRDEWPPIA